MTYFTIQNFLCELLVRKMTQNDFNPKLFHGETLSSLRNNKLMFLCSILFIVKIIAR